MLTKLSQILGLLTPEVWAGAILGALVSAVFAVSTGFLRQFAKLFPLRRLLGDLANNDVDCLVFVRGMFVQNNTFLSRVPQQGAPLQIIVQQWVNIPEVFGAADVRAASDLFNLLGEAGRRERIQFASIERDWDRWNSDLVCIGGHFKTDRVLQLAAASLVQYRHPNAFASTDGTRTFPAGGAGGTTDYGLVLKVTHPVTSRTCLVLMGLGGLGTEAAAHYLRFNARMLGRLFGARDFAVIVEGDVAHGKEAARVCWFSPVPSRIKRILHPFHWFRRLRHAGP